MPRELILKILKIAGRAPSGSNVQPWRVWVLEGAVKVEVARDLAERYDGARRCRANTTTIRRHGASHTWRGDAPAVEGLYGTLGIGRADKDKMHAQHRRNFLFFDAPIGLIFSIDRDLELGSWLDYGMFLQSIMVAARQFGLGNLPAGRLPGVLRRAAASTRHPGRAADRLRHVAGLSRLHGAGQRLHRRSACRRKIL